MTKKGDLARFLERCDEALNEMALYRLDGENRVVRGTFADWIAMKLEGERCIVGRTQVGELLVSTVFLGLDHNHARVIHPELPTMCFETMVFGDSKSSVEDRYSTWEEAEAGHHEIVRRLMK